MATFSCLLPSCFAIFLSVDLAHAHSSKQNFTGIKLIVKKFIGKWFGKIFIHKFTRIFTFVFGDKWSSVEYYFKQEISIWLTNDTLKCFAIDTHACKQESDRKCSSDAFVISSQQNGVICYHFHSAFLLIHPVLPLHEWSVNHHPFPGLFVESRRANKSSCLFKIFETLFAPTSCQKVTLDSWGSVFAIWNTNDHLSHLSWNLDGRYF